MKIWINYNDPNELKIIDDIFNDRSFIERALVLFNYLWYELLAIWYFWDSKSETIAQWEFAQYIEEKFEYPYMWYTFFNNPECVGLYLINKTSPEKSFNISDYKRFLMPKLNDYNFLVEVTQKLKSEDLDYSKICNKQFEDLFNWFLSYRKLEITTTLHKVILKNNLLK